MKPDSRQRVAVIDFDKCNPKKCGNWLCESACPVNRAGKKCIAHLGEEKPNISELLCIGCLICQKKCPFGAISIVNLSMQLDLPIHQYGKNSFRLHGLPLPKEGNVVGLIGRNGLGKTTALNILSGKIVPNLGNLDEEPSWVKVVQCFRGKEAQAYFEKISLGKISVSVKPQQVDLLPKAVKGNRNVAQLLHDADETNGFEEAVKGLSLETVLENNLQNLSGGELQKVAIAAASMKKADLFFFDEPTSYLDIGQRINAAKFICGIAEKGKSVLVVEHDLIVLDYLSDFVHLLYGKPACFGMASQVKATKSGINEYLEGFSKEENYRFRERAIEFTVKAARKSKKETVLANWPAFSKKLGNFKLNVKQGALNRGEVVGILGENATGKTTFAKIIAGALNPDGGKIDLKLKISYKPQQLNPEGSGSIADFLKKKGKEFGADSFNSEILRPLELGHLLEKSVSSLSGGELQRVAIAGCLAQEADILLLDEPSAHLDVEQRLLSAKAIRNFVETRNISALVIDHDLVFLDYLSDRVMFFGGTPAKEGIANSPVAMEQGMNALLSSLGITLRREKNGRPRINKLGSVLDREQKKSGKYYYT